MDSQHWKTEDRSEEEHRLCARYITKHFLRICRAGKLEHGAPMSSFNPAQLLLLAAMTSQETFDKIAPLAGYIVLYNKAGRLLAVIEGKVRKGSESLLITVGMQETAQMIGWIMNDGQQSLC